MRIYRTSFNWEFGSYYFVGLFHITESRKATAAPLYRYFDDDMNVTHKRIALYKLLHENQQSTVI